MDTDLPFTHGFPHTDSYQKNQACFIPDNAADVKKLTMMQSVGKQGRFSKLTITTFVCENGYAVGGGGGGGGGGAGGGGGGGGVLAVGRSNSSPYFPSVT